MGLKSLNRKALLGIIDGKEVMPFWGAEGDGGEGEGGNSSGSNAGDRDDDDDDDDDDGDGGDSSQWDEKDKKIHSLSSEARNRRKALRAAERERDELKRQLEERDGAKKDTEKHLQGELEKANSRAQKMEGVLRKNLLETHILKDNKITWHDVDVVVAALDLGEIDIDVESGTVEGLSDELKRVAREKPFLVKSKSGSRQNGGDDGGSGQQQRRGSTGNNPGGAGHQQNQQVTQRESLLKKYKALQR